jgi:hypothetical protein
MSPVLAIQLQRRLSKPATLLSDVVYRPIPEVQRVKLPALKLSFAEGLARHS